MRRSSAAVLPYSVLVLGLLVLLAAVIALLGTGASSSGSREAPIKITGAEYQVPPYGETSTPPTTEVLSAGFEAAPQGEVLAATGANHLIPYGALAIALFGVGGLLLRISRRRGASNASST
jgi:hypothetical protein